LANQPSRTGSWSLDWSLSSSEDRQQPYLEFISSTLERRNHHELAARTYNAATTFPITNHKPQCSIQAVQQLRNNFGTHMPIMRQKFLQNTIAHGKTLGPKLVKVKTRYA
jgi:hypothetical protein